MRGEMMIVRAKLEQDAVRAVGPHLAVDELLRMFRGRLDYEEDTQLNSLLDAIEAHEDARREYREALERTNIDADYFTRPERDALEQARVALKAHLDAYIGMQVRGVLLAYGIIRED